MRAAFDAECLSKWGNHAAVLECIDTITKVPAHAENNNLIAMTVIYYTQCDKSAYSENTVRYLQTYVEAHKEAVMKASDWSFQLVQGWIQNGSTESDAWQLWCHSHQRPMNVFAEVLNRTIKTETVR